MNIGIDARSLLIDRKEGMHVYADNIIRSFAKLHASHRFFLYVDHTPDEEFLHSFPEHFTWISLRPPLFWPQTRFSVHLLRNPHHCDIVYFPTQSIAFTSLPTVAVIHDVAFLKFPEHFTAWNRFVLSHLTTNFTIRNATALIAISQHTKQDVIAHYHAGESQLTVIHHGYDRATYYPRSREEVEAARIRYNITNPYIVFLGTLQRRKNILRLVQAFHELKRNNRIPHQLVIIGKKGWLYEEIFKYVSANKLKDEILFTGYVSKDDAAALLSGADVYVLPSLYEGFGLPVLEAMACGTPVILSNVSSLPEIAGGAALTISDPENVQEIQKAILRLVRDKPLQSQLQKQGFKRVQQFSWMRSAEQTLQLIEQTAQQKNI